MKIIPFRMLMLVLGLLLLSGCNSVPKRDPDFAPVSPQMMAPPPAVTGSIYQAGYAQSLFEDNRARRIGDILTVRLEESTSAERDSATNVKRETTTTIANPTLFGNVFAADLPGIIPSGNNAGLNLNSTLSSSNETKGTGDADQSNSFSGSITVMVTEVLPNGYLRVRGEKRLSLTEGHEYIRLAGIIRPTDLDGENSVSSLRVADATIQYVGDGPIADANKMGWLARFFISSIWPF